MCKMLDAEFALVLYDTETDSIMAARDLWELGYVLWLHKRRS